MKEAIISAALSGLIQYTSIMVKKAGFEVPVSFGENLKGPDEPGFNWTQSFLDQINPSYKKYIVYTDSNKLDSETFLRIKIARSLSLPRTSGNEIHNKNEFKPYLVSIFDRVKLDRHDENGKGTHYLPLKKLALEKEHIFPQPPDQHHKVSYNELVKDFLVEAKKEFDKPESYIENLESALQKYAWCIPSPDGENFLDVSIYDQARITSALAVCLTDFEEDELTEIDHALLALNGNDVLQNNISEQPAALLVGGDISGIQDFIYTIFSKRAAKTLRGRSFYLQLLTEAVLRYVLRRLDLPYTNVIYSGGGHFFLLAPVSAASLLPEIQKEISTKLLDMHDISLYLALGWAHVPFKGFSSELFTDYWGEMHQSLQKKKHQRYTELDLEHLNNIFTPDQQGGDEDKLCEVCGREQPNVSVIEDSDESQTGIRVCSLCQSFADEIGKELPAAKFIRLGFSSPFKAGTNSALEGLAEFGMQVRFDSVPFIHKVDQSVVWQISDKPSPVKIGEGSVVWQRYVVNELPLDDFGKPISFDVLQDMGRGIHRLGVLRMDVDNLGSIFQAGMKYEFGKPIGSLVHLSTLSFQFSLFFEGFIKRILEAPDYKGCIYAVYSGGDDLFLIGPWHLMPKLALEIVKSLEAYTGGNPDIHLSGGMSFIHGKYPIHAASEDAGELEKKAKNAFGDQKKAFAFLGKVMHWEDFIKVNQHKEVLIKIIEELKGSKSLLQHLKKLDQMQVEAKKNKNSEKPIWGPWMWMGDYQLSRMIERAKGDLQHELKLLHEQLKSGKYPYADLNCWALAARWAELELREEKNK
jgi:CRISPR-associated protein Csm1